MISTFVSVQRGVSAVRAIHGFNLFLNECTWWVMYVWQSLSTAPKVTVKTSGCVLTRECCLPQWGCEVSISLNMTCFLSYSELQLHT